MSSKNSPTNSSIFFYIPLVIIAIALIGFIFNWQFQGGLKFGASLPPPVKEIPAEQKIDHRALAKQTSLAADGKMLYEINCSSCHGPTGEGNGARAAGLNPPPRNYKTEKFKFGDDVVAIRNTVLQGSPGSSMPSFALLPQKDVWALAHYVRTLIPNPTPTDDAILAKLPAGDANGAAGTIDMATDTVARHRIPIKLAMQQVADNHYSYGQTTRAYDESSLGAQIYLQKCAGCHGKFGEGKQAMMLGANPYRYENTPPMYNYATKLADKASFDGLILTGKPGRVHPGFGTLTRAQLDALYAFVQSLSKF